MNMMIFSMLTFTILMIIYLMNKLISMIKKTNFEKNLPFECGFNPITKSNLPFSLPFFLISLMFLIFDVEIILLIPLIYYLKILNSMILLLIIMMFFILLILTLLIEWMFNYLNWMF
nr:TPA: ND3 [Bombus confusus]